MTFAKVHERRQKSRALSALTVAMSDTAMRGPHGATIPWDGSPRPGDPVEVWTRGSPHVVQTLVEDEQRRQIRLFGVQHISPEAWLAVLVEEVGEVAHGRNELRDAHKRGDRADAARWEDNILEELIQVAAVAQSAAQDLLGRRELAFPFDGQVAESVQGSDPARWWEAA